MTLGFDSDGALDDPICHSFPALYNVVERCLLASLEKSGRDSDCGQRSGGPGSSLLMATTIRPVGWPEIAVLIPSNVASVFSHCHFSKYWRKGIFAHKSSHIRNWNTHDTGITIVHGKTVRVARCATSPPTIGHNNRVRVRTSHTENSRYPLWRTATSRTRRHTPIIGH